MLEVISKELRHYQKDKLAAYQKKNQGIEAGGIVFAGDSLIEFFPLKKYFKQVSTIYNRGIAGIDSQWLLEHIDSHVNDLSPSHVFILIGCNDIGLGFNQSHIVSTIVDLISRIRSQSIYTRISLLSILPVSENLAYQATVKLRTNRAIDEINQALAMIPAIEFIDLNACLKDETGGLADAYTIDGIHLNSLGYEHLAQAISPYL